MTVVPMTSVAHIPFCFDNDTVHRSQTQEAEALIVVVDSVKTKQEPGWVIVDTACTLSLIGNETMKDWEHHLKASYYMTSLRTDDVNVRFPGLNGESRSTEARCWPMMIGQRLGGLTTAVVPGNVPCLYPSRQ